jgi:hypothetical protein
VAIRGAGNSRPLLLALLLGWSAAAGAWTPSLEVAPLAVEMNERDARVLFRKDPNDQSSFAAAVVIPDGTRLTGRIQGKGGFSRGFAKKPLLIKLDAPHKWRGQSRIALNAMGVDRSNMREWLAWDLIHALGMAAPQTQYVRLSINGQDHGLFFWLEWIGPATFERYGYGREVEMYDPVDSISCADLSPVSVQEPEVCWVKITPRDDDWSTLRALIDEIHATPVDAFDAFLERRFDVESVINYFVVTVLVSNTTTYDDEYFPVLSRKTGQWFIVPWAYDRSFGWNYEPYFPEPIASNSDNFQYYYPIELGVYNPVRDKVLTNTKLRRRFETRLREVLEGTPDKARPWRGWFAPERLRRRIDEVYAVVSRELSTDPLGPKRERFEEAVGALRHYALARALYFGRYFAGGAPVPDVGRGPLPAAGAASHVTDGAGFYLAGLRGGRAASRGTVEVTVRHGWLEYVPPGADRAACIQRSWLLTPSAAAQADVTVEYRDENSRRHERGPAVGDEGGLALYARVGSSWSRLPTAVNAYANTLEGRGLRLPAGQTARLVACPASAAVAAR